FSEQITNGKDAGNKARNDIEAILNTKYIPLTAYTDNPKKNIIYSYIKLFREVFKTKKEDYIVIQYPLLQGYNKCLKYISKFRNVIIIIHDLTQLRIGDLSGEEEKRFHYVKHIISHNQKMTNFLIKRNISENNIINL